MSKSCLRIVIRRVKMTMVAAVTFLFTAGLHAANLVPNGDFSLGNTQFGSDYAFAAFTPCNNTVENQYTVGTNPSTWNCAGVVVSTGDHTTGTGNMLLGNGGNTGLRVWFTTVPIPVIPNTTYFFEAWLLNWSTTSVGSNAAQLTFRANGVDLATATATGAGVWTPVSTTWNSGANTTVSLTLFDSTPTVTGNDFAVDDIVFNTSSSILTPTTFNIAGGGSQTTQVGTAFGQSLAVLVRDQNGNPLPGATVNYIVNPVAGASATLSSALALTDGGGVARVSATANAVAGSYTVTVSVAGISGTATFNLTNTVPATILAPTNIPALSTLSLALLATLLGFFGWFTLKRR